MYVVFIYVVRPCTNHPYVVLCYVVLIYVIVPYVVRTTKTLYVGSRHYGGHPWDEDPRGVWRVRGTPCYGPIIFLENPKDDNVVIHALFNAL